MFEIGTRIVDFPPIFFNINISQKYQMYDVK